MLSRWVANFGESKHYVEQFLFAVCQFLDAGVVPPKIARARVIPPTNTIK